MNIVTDDTARLSVWLDALGVGYSLSLTDESFTLAPDQVRTLKERMSDRPADQRIPGFSSPLTAQYVQGYAIGYRHGYEHGDEDHARIDLVKRHGVSTGDNTDAYIGFDHGYTDGIEHYSEDQS